MSLRSLLLALALVACLSVCVSGGSTFDWAKGGGGGDVSVDAGGGPSQQPEDAVKDGATWESPAAKDEDGQLDMKDLIKARDTADQTAADDAVLQSSTTSSSSTITSKTSAEHHESSSSSSSPTSDKTKTETETESESGSKSASKRVHLDHLAGDVILLHGGLSDGGVSAESSAVLAGLGRSTHEAGGLVFCQLRENNSAKTHMLASPGSAALDNKAYFHGGYKVWSGGNDFKDVDQLSVFDGEQPGWECAGDDCRPPTLGGKDVDRQKGRADASPGRRDEHVAVITPRPVALPGGGGGGRGANRGSAAKQRAMIVFGGRDEQDVRLDTMYALGLEDKIWRKIDYKKPTVKKSSAVEQGPFDMPAVIKHAHAHGELFPLARSGATAVVTPDNVMYMFGGFVVEGRLGFNVGELLACDLNTFEFFYPAVSGDLPVRRNKHTAVMDDRQRMWLWGGSVWDHTGGSATYASTALYVADLRDPKHVKWTKVETQGVPPSQRRLHSAVHRDGVMYVVGGEDYHSKAYLQDVHALDLETLTWSQPAVKGNAGGGHIRAAALGLKMKHPGAALKGCGKGAPAAAVTGELQPKNDRLVTVLEETAASMGKRPDANLFAAAMGKGSNDATAIAAGWIPDVPRREPRTTAAGAPAKLLVETRDMWQIRLLANVSNVGLVRVGEDDLPGFGGAVFGDEEAGVVEGADGWAAGGRAAERRDGFKTETKEADIRDAKTAKRATARAAGDDGESSLRVHQLKSGGHETKAGGSHKGDKAGIKIAHREAMAGFDENNNLLAQLEARRMKKLKSEQAAAGKTSPHARRDADERASSGGADDERAASEEADEKAERAAAKAKAAAAAAEEAEAEEDVRAAEAIAKRDTAKAGMRGGPSMKTPSAEANEKAVKNGRGVDPVKVSRGVDSVYATAQSKDEEEFSADANVKSEPLHVMKQAAVAGGATVEGSRLSHQVVPKRAASAADDADAAAAAASVKSEPLHVMKQAAGAGGATVEGSRLSHQVVPKRAASAAAADDADDDESAVSKKKPMARLGEDEASVALTSTRTLIDANGRVIKVNSHTSPRSAVDESVAAVSAAADHAQSDPAGASLGESAEPSSDVEAAEEAIPVAEFDIDAPEGDEFRAQLGEQEKAATVTRAQTEAEFDAGIAADAAAMFASMELDPASEGSRFAQLGAAAPVVTPKAARRRAAKVRAREDAENAAIGKSSKKKNDAAASSEYGSSIGSNLEWLRKKEEVPTEGEKDAAADAIHAELLAKVKLEMAKQGIHSSDDDTDAEEKNEKSPAHGKKSASSKDEAARAKAANDAVDEMIAEEEKKEAAKKKDASSADNSTATAATAAELLEKERSAEAAELDADIDGDIERELKKMKAEEDAVAAARAAEMAEAVKATEASEAEAIEPAREPTDAEKASADAKKAAQDKAVNDAVDKMIAEEEMEEAALEEKAKAKREESVANARLDLDRLTADGAEARNSTMELLTADVDEAQEELQQEGERNQQGVIANARQHEEEANETTSQTLEKEKDVAGVGLDEEGLLSPPLDVSTTAERRAELLRQQEALEEEQKGRERKRAERVAFDRAHPNYRAVAVLRKEAENAVAAAVAANAQGAQKHAMQLSIAQEKAVKELEEIEERRKNLFAEMEERKQNFKFSSGMAEADPDDTPDAAAAAIPTEKSAEAVPMSALGAFASKTLSRFMNPASPSPEAASDTTASKFSFSSVIAATAPKDEEVEQEAMEEFKSLREPALGALRETTTATTSSSSSPSAAAAAESLPLGKTLKPALSALGAAALMAVLGAVAARRVAGAVAGAAAAVAARRGSGAERISLVMEEGGLGATPLAPPFEPVGEATWQKAAAARWQHHFGDSYGMDDSV